MNRLLWSVFGISTKERHADWLELPNVRVKVTWLASYVNEEFI